MSQKPTNTKDETKPDAQADLDARVASLLGEMDETHDRVVQRLDWPAGSEQDELDRQLSEAMASVAEVADAPPPSAMREQVAAGESDDTAAPKSLDDALSETLAPAPAAARREDPVVVGSGDQGEGASESIASEVAAIVETPAAKVNVVEVREQVDAMLAAKADEAAPEVAAPVVTAPPVAAVAPVAAPAPVVAAKPATITDLDNQLSQALAEPTDDEFADASEVLASESPRVDLKALRQEPATVEAAAQPAAVEPPVVVAAKAAAVAAPARDAEFEAPSVPVAPAAPAVKPAAVVTPKPAPKPAVKAATSDEPKMTLADMFWRVATPIVEPIASQLGRLPVKTQQTFAWIGMTTMFVGCVTWGYVLFLMPTKPPSQLLEEQEQREAAAGESGERGEKPAAKSSAKGASKSGGGHASADRGHGGNAAADEHAEPAPSGHGTAKSGGH